ncbi:hypothetical protein BSKO_01465 [Bryopsis sp. KO-2023]|nr:hypothetical protein BSKO_01465 [Bryopsis sp. KO-2023]
MSKQIPLDKQINAQWFGTKLTPAPSAKVVEGKVKVEEVPKAVEPTPPPPPPPAVEEELVEEEPVVVEEVPEPVVEVRVPAEGKKRKLVAKLGVPVAAAVVAWAFVAKPFA